MSIFGEPQFVLTRMEPTTAAAAPVRLLPSGADTADLAEPNVAIGRGRADVSSRFVSFIDPSGTSSKYSFVNILLTTLEHKNKQTNKNTPSLPT